MGTAKSFGYSAFSFPSNAWRAASGIMKEAGYNAICSSHNPCSRAMLEACDELGVYMMDETWDMWFHHKSKYDYASDWRQHHEDDGRALAIVRGEHAQLTISGEHL